MDRRHFNEGYARLIVAFRDYKAIVIEEGYVSEDGFELGKWLAEMRCLWNKRKLPKKYSERLKRIGISKDPKMQSWESMWFQAQIYLSKHGNIDVGVSYRTEDGLLLGAWINRQREFSNDLTDEQRMRLKEIGIDI